MLFYVALVTYSYQFATSYDGLDNVRLLSIHSTKFPSIYASLVELSDLFTFSVFFSSRIQNFRCVFSPLFRLYASVKHHIHIIAQFIYFFSLIMSRNLEADYQKEWSDFVSGKIDGKTFTKNVKDLPNTFGDSRNLTGWIAKKSASLYVSLQQVEKKNNELEAKLAETEIADEAQRRKIEELERKVAELEGTAKTHVQTIQQQNNLLTVPVSFQKRKKNEFRKHENRKLCTLIKGSGYLQRISRINANILH